MGETFRNGGAGMCGAREAHQRVRLNPRAVFIAANLSAVLLSPIQPLPDAQATEKKVVVTVSPSNAVVPADGTQLFKASVREDDDDDDKQRQVSWSMTAKAGQILSTGPLTALVRVGNVVGHYPNAVTASFDKKSSDSASIVIVPGQTPTPTPTATTTRVPSATPIRTPTATTQPTQTPTPGATTPTPIASSTPGPFTPIRLYAPVTLRDTPLDIDNHTACTALSLNPPATVVQAASDPFNIYRFVATTGAFTINLSNYVTSGQLLLYRVVEDTCATAGTLSVAFVESSIITGSSFGVRFSTFEPGQTYLLAVNTLGSLTDQFYSITVQP